MSEPKRKLCDVCLTRSATHRCVTISDGVKLHRDLCTECFDASTITMGHDVVTSLDQMPCDYCGTPACAAGTDVLQALCSIQVTNHMCSNCYQEYHSYTIELLDHMQMELSQEEELAAIQRLPEIVDRHMKQWVNERRGHLS